jgi:threonine synthase
VNDLSNVVSLGEGCTPLVSATLLGGSVLLKHDYLCPTGSYKDRGSAVLMSKLKEWGVAEVIEDSSGNAGASIAAYAAMAGIRANVYVPASASAGKLAQIAIYGANLVRVEGTREDTTAAAMAAAESVFYASHNWSPYFLTGLKTAAYEIAEQTEWQSPDWIVCPVGGGNLLVAMYEGFREMVEFGLLDRMPRFAAVQAANCAPVYAGWRAGMEEPPRIVKHDTAAEGIATARPVRGAQILNAIRVSDGYAVTVSEDVIWETFEELGTHGIYVEPTSAAAPGAVAELRRRHILQEGERVVVMLTGSGLKATDKIMDQFKLGRVGDEESSLVVDGARPLP